MDSSSAKILSRDPGRQLEGEKWCLSDTDLKLLYKTVMQHLSKFLFLPSFLSQQYRVSWHFNPGILLGENVKVRWKKKEGFQWEARELWEQDFQSRASTKLRSCLPWALLVHVATPFATLPSGTSFYFVPLCQLRQIASARQTTFI